MKVNKKVVLSTAAVLGIAAFAIGGTIAYFTDHDDKTNHFTVGDVDITLYESQLHRQNSGRAGDFPGLASDPTYCDWNATVTTTMGDSRLITVTNSTEDGYEKARYCTPHTDAANTTGISAVTNGHTKASRNWGYTDQQIIDDDTDYKKSIEEGDDHDGYFTKVSQNIVPGQWVRKFAYVKNESTSSDAYVVIRYMVPTSYSDNITLKIPGTPYEEDIDGDSSNGVQGYFTALNYNDTDDSYSAYTLTTNGIDDYEGYIQVIDNVEYRVYAAVTTQTVNPGEMTFWSPINTVKLNNNVSKTDVAPATQIDVKVDARAIQAKTFSDAIKAVNELL